MHDFIEFSEEEDEEAEQEKRRKINFDEEDEETIKLKKMQSEILGVSDLGDKKKDSRSIKNSNDFSKVKH